MSVFSSVSDAKAIDSTQNIPPRVTLALGVIAVCPPALLAPAATAIYHSLVPVAAGVIYHAAKPKIFPR